MSDESTGKTTLARSLGAAFSDRVGARIRARIHDDEYGRIFDGRLLVEIAKHQLSEENQLALQANRLLFTDTEIITAKVWCEDVFSFCPGWLSQQLNEHRYDLFLLTANDLPWVADPVRVNPQRRDYFFNLYKRLMDEMKFPYEIISGRYEARLLSGINGVKKHFNVE